MRKPWQMKDYSNGQFEQRAIVTSSEKGKYVLALVRRRLSADAVEIDPLTRRGAMALREARRLLPDYLPHEVLYRIEGYRGGVADHESRRKRSRMRGSSSGRSRRKGDAVTL